MRSLPLSVLSATDLYADPLFADGVDGTVVLVVVVKTVVTFAAYLVSVMLMVWFERKLIGDMQNRIGPNRAGPWGLLQTLADGIKLFFKEPLNPERADRGIYKLAPYLALVPALAAFAIVPLSMGTVTLFGKRTSFQLADPPIGILFLLACSSVAVYGVMLAGWSSGSKYPLLGSVRASAQMVSYEAALGLTVTMVVLATGSLLTSDIVASQAGEGPGGVLPDWNLLRLGVVPFFLFIIAATAELNRPPFDLVEAEQELVGGFHTEYSSIGFALFFLAEFGNTITMSAIVVTLFLGGPAGPVPIGPMWVWGFMWFFVKTVVFLFMYVWLRATLPRLRYDQLMDLGWKKLIPLSLVWLLGYAAVRTLGDADGATAAMTLAGVVIGAFMVYALLSRAMEVGRRRSTAEAEAADPVRRLKGA